jgi:predicted transcriptional regulator
MVKKIPLDRKCNGGYLVIMDFNYREIIPLNMYSTLFKLSDRVLTLYFYLVDMGVDAPCNLTNQELSAELGVSSTTISRYISTLKNHNLIKTTYRPSKHGEKRSIYLLGLKDE